MVRPSSARAFAGDPRDADIFGAPSDPDTRDASTGTSTSTAAGDEASREGTRRTGESRNDSRVGNDKSNGSDGDSGSDHRNGNGDYGNGDRFRDGDGLATDEDDRGFDGAGAAASSIQDKLEDAKRFLEIGGELWLWLEYDALYDGPPKQFALRSPSFVDVYADARPSDRLRGFVQGRLKYDFTVVDGSVDAFQRVQNKTDVVLDQLWLKTDLAHQVFITFGRQRIRWGVGRFWNPTDFLNTSRRDPLAVFDQRLGVGLLKLHVPVEAYGWNFYAIANLEDAHRLDAVGAALRAEVVVGPAEVSLTGAYRKDEPLRLGADVSAGFGWVDLKAEGAFLHGVTSPFFRGPLDVASRVTPTVFSRKDDWIVQAVASVELTVPIGEEDSVVLGGEYFYNSAGYGDEKLYPWLIYQQAWTPLYVGRHYAGAYAFVSGPGRWDHTTFLLSGLGNLSDGSVLVRFDYSVQLLSYLSLHVFSSVHVGSEGELRLRIHVDPTSIVPELQNGLDVSPPLAELGLTLNMAL